MIHALDEIETAPEVVDPYATLQRRARRALDQAELQKAAKLFEWAYVEARRQGDPALEERAYCNMALSAVTTGSATRYLGGLKTIAGGSEDPETRFLAAYDLATVFDNSSDRQEARFYAEIARQLAATSSDPFPRAAASYLLGKLWLGDCRLQPAQRSIEDSIELLDRRGDAQNYALENSTLGYCLMLMGQPVRALTLLEASLRAITGAGSRLYEPAARLNLGFALLEAEDFEGAHLQAEDALALPCGPLDRKYALYLAGETANYLGEFDLAGDRFRRLQEEFFPEMPSLAGELLANPIHGAISWLA